MEPQSMTTKAKDFILLEGKDQEGNQIRSSGTINKMDGVNTR